MRNTSPEAVGDAERIERRPDVKRALQQTSPDMEVPPPVVETKDKLWFGTYLIAGLVLVSLYFLLRLEFLTFVGKYLVVLQRFSMGAVWIVLVLAAAKVIEIYWIGRIENIVSRYNLTRILRLVMALVVGLIGISVLFENWYTAIVSLGVISLILGFALQTPITSFIGWIYILVREPYRVGDRIKIGEVTGDVIEVNYLDTTLWEFGGEYLSTDHPSGRLIKFPNSNVLDSPVYNYSWPLFPYIWNEIKFDIAYESNLEFVAKTMQEVTEEELGEFMMQRVKVYRDLLAKTPVDHLDVQERPTVVFRPSTNTWIEAIVRYVVHPKEQGRVKTRIIKKLLAKLNAAPDLVLFPKGNAR